MSDEGWNKATFVFEFAPDKWMGLESFQKDVQLLKQVADRLGMTEGRRKAALTIEVVSMDDEPGPYGGSE